MLEKFLISIGLKQPSSLEPYVDDSTTTVRPSTENRFTNEEEYAGDIRVHQPKNEVEGLGIPIKDGFIVAMDIRDIEDQTERRRILDFTFGMVFVNNSSMRSINKDGVYLILPPNSSLPSQERERLQELGLYRVNV
jgi:FtsZ-interacting cell division protein YlmF